MSSAPTGNGRALDLRDPGPRARRHDPRVEPPTKRDKRRLWGWVAVLGFSPLCLAVVAWAALGLNGSYPTVKPPVPAGWKAERGIYASVSVPKHWALRQFLSDDSGDAYYSGAGGGIGVSVVEDDHEPAHAGHLPSVVGTFLQGKYHITSVTPVKLHNAADAWKYSFSVAGGTTGAAILAWAKVTESEVWVVTSKVSPLTQQVFTTLTLAS